MRVLLLGGTDLTLAVAEATLRAGVDLAGVVHLGTGFNISYRPSGVSNVRYANMADWCEAHGVAASDHTTPREIASFGARIGADFLLAAGWYHMVPTATREAFARGAAGIHASLLPQLRGGAPLNWAILLDLKRTGVSLFGLSDGVDDGPLYGQRTFPIEERAVIGDLVERSRELAADLIEDCLPRIAAGTLHPWPQVGQPSYGLQRAPEDGAIDWSRPVDEIDRLIRAVSHPYPGAFTTLGSERISIWRAEPYCGPTVYGAPGQIFRAGGLPGAVAGAGVLVIEEASLADGQNAVPVLLRSSQQRLGKITGPL